MGGCEALLNLKKMLFLKEGAVGFWPLEQPAESSMTSTSTISAASRRVGNVMSWAENSPCCYQSKSRICCNLHCLCCRPFQPSLPAGTCEHIPSPFLIVFPAPLHNERLFGFANWSRAVSIAGDTHRGGMDFIWVLGPSERMVPK